jgi:hypothetical protein
MTPIWLQIYAKPKWATQRIQIISKEKFLYLKFLPLIFTNFESFKTFFFDMWLRKKRLVKTHVHKNALSAIYHPI